MTFCLDSHFLCYFHCQTFTFGHVHCIWHKHNILDVSEIFHHSIKFYLGIAVSYGIVCVISVIEIIEIIFYMLLIIHSCYHCLFFIRNFFIFLAILAMSSAYSQSSLAYLSIHLCPLLLLSNAHVTISLESYTL